MVAWLSFRAVWCKAVSGLEEGDFFSFLSNYILSNAKMKSCKVFYWKPESSTETCFIRKCNLGAAWHSCINLWQTDILALILYCIITHILYMYIQIDLSVCMCVLIESVCINYECQRLCILSNNMSVGGFIKSGQH